MKQVREGYKMTELGEIPTGWEVKRLELLVEIKSGNSPAEFVLNEDGIYPFYKVDDMNYTEKTLSKAKLYFNESRFKLMPTGMVVFPKRGASIFTNKVAILDSEGYFDTNIMGLICKKELNNEFLFYKLKLIELKQFADTTAVPQINNKHINPLSIPVPPLPEQKKIASILSKVDEQIELTDNLIEKTKDLKKGLMQNLLTKGIGHTEFKETEVGKIPTGWEVKTLKSISIKIIDNRGKTPPTEYSGYELIEGYQLDNQSIYPKIDIKRQKYVGERIYTSWFRSGHPIAGDLLFTTVGNIASTALIPVGKEYCIAQNIFSVRFTEKVSSLFMLYYTRTKYFRKKINGLVMSAVQPSIKLPHILDIVVPVPSLDEQKKIASILSSVDTKIEEYQNKKSKLEELKKGLMQQLLTGKIRVKVDSDIYALVNQEVCENI